MSKRKDPVEVIEQRFAELPPREQADLICNLATLLPPEDRAFVARHFAVMERKPSPAPEKRRRARVAADAPLLQGVSNG